MIQQLTLHTSCDAQLIQIYLPGSIKTHKLVSCEVMQRYISSIVHLINESFAFLYLFTLPTPFSIKQSIHLNIEIIHLPLEIEALKGMFWK